MLLNLDFWEGRRILLTGHTGFKGAWMALLLEGLGAEVFGISLPPPTKPSLYDILSPWPRLSSYICDLRDRQKLGELVRAADPELVIHMAAQPLVRESYHSPLDTLEINIMGTANLLESLRLASNFEAGLIITTDKVYLNHQIEALTETNPLGGRDLYSASKAATEIVIQAYAHSFFEQFDVKLCTARAGNVIGGGDWAKDRILPDLWRAYSSGRPISLRYPEAIRPWQHVLDPLYGYLLYLERMMNDASDIPSAMNFGPPIKPVRTVLELAKSFSESLENSSLFMIGESDSRYKENKFLSIDASLAKRTLGWQTALDVDTAILWTCEWYKAFRDGKQMRRFSNHQIADYLNLLQTNTASKKSHDLIFNG